MGPFKKRPDHGKTVDQEHLASAEGKDQPPNPVLQVRDAFPQPDEPHRGADGI